MFPRVRFKIKELPSKKEIHLFYSKLPSFKDKVIFLVLATSGLRLDEVMHLAPENVDLVTGIVKAKAHTGTTKKSLLSFINDEPRIELRKYLETGGSLPFPVSASRLQDVFKATSIETKVKITPKTLREFFASEMAELGLNSSYIDFFCGRVPQSVLAKHYLDYSINKLQSIYNKAGLRVLTESRSGEEPKVFRSWPSYATD